ncbi:unnamed protein product [Calicophoron daubneyi]
MMAAKTVRLLGILNEKTAELSSSDISMYTGLAGVGYFFARLSNSKSGFFSKEVLDEATRLSQKMVRRCLRHVETDKFHRNVSVFTSPVGAFFLGAIVSSTEGEPASSGASSRDDCVKQVLSAQRFASVWDSGMPDEALYGRTGYLNALILLREANLNVPTQAVHEVVEAIIKSGTHGSHACSSDGTYRELMRDSGHEDLLMPPLMFAWHGKYYLGGAHGFAGILLTLINVHRLFPDALNSDTLNRYVLPTIRWYSELQLESGNWPSSLGESCGRDVLVHWCHGATGAVPLMLSAYELWHEEIFLKKALKAGDAIWARGLLHKGCGICHGSAGSGYALLDLYRFTKDTKYLYRASKFSEWCTDCFQNRKRVPDRPYSLFEGLAGTLYFLVEILDPLAARFPLLHAA